jgi:hypothetical protein
VPAEGWSLTRPHPAGATAIEYGLIAAIVAVGIIVGLGSLRDGLNTLRCRAAMAGVFGIRLWALGAL